MFSRVTSVYGGRHVLSTVTTNQENNVFLQFVRWRKRRWAPIAKSKIYYVRKPTPIVPEEAEELRRRYNHYRTIMRGIFNYIREDYLAKKATASSVTLLEEEENRFALLLEENRRWNEETAKLREARQQEEAQQVEQQKLLDLIQMEEEGKAEKERAKRRLEREKEMSQTFITEENLEEEIEKALNMRVNYNFAIDLEGNRYIEKEDGSTSIETKEAEPVRIYALPEEPQQDSTAAQS